MPTSTRITFISVFLAALFLCLEVTDAMAQIYRPPKPYSMWDTWLFRNGDEYHLFFLQSEPNVTWNTIGRAVSKDLVHWKTLPPIPSKGPAGAWDHDPTLTGMTVKRGDDYVLFYGSASHGQKIGLMLSNDLEHWEKHPGNPTLSIKGPHYAGSDWRDMCTFYDPADGAWHGYVCAQVGGGEPKLPTITDKTLVAWVRLANTEQRGGSVLTLDYGRGPGDVFDGIVFGERAPGRWMAGSNFWRRSQEDQSANPAETAGPDVTVQMAITYSGRNITIYRDGQMYVEYTAADQQAFGSGSAVVMGLRHIGAGTQQPRFFAGAIEEARIYDVALSQEQIAALKPGAPSDPKPLAQWTFEDGSTRDSMGTFPPGELHGGARVADGMLHLDGVEDYMATPGDAGLKAAVAHLRSKDLVEWEYLPAAFASAEFVDMEVPDYFELGGRHYLLFSSGRSRKDTSGRRNASGTFYVMADRRDGPYRIPEKPLLLGSGNGRFDNYVGRTIPFGDTRLLYHHTAGGTVCWGTPKLVRQNDDGTLWLQYWDGLDGLKKATLLEGAPEGDLGELPGAGEWQVKDKRLTGEGAGEPSVLWLPVNEDDLSLVCSVGITSAKRVGVVWRWDGSKGFGITLGRHPDRAAVVRVDSAPAGVVTNTIDEIDDLDLPDGDVHVRVLVRAHRAELYLNDRWVFGTSLTDMSASGRLGLLVHGGSATFSRLEVSALEPLP